MKLKFSAAALAVVAIAGLAGQAGAATVTAASGSPTDDLMTPAAVSGPVYLDIDYSAGWSRSPWNNGDASFYTSIVGWGSVSYAFGGLIHAIDVLWGTPDTYNTVEFLHGGTVVDSVNGVEVRGKGHDSFDFAEYVTLTSATAFDSVRFVSQGIAFEYVLNAPAAVPVPAAGLLLAGAVAGLGVASRRRRAAV